MHSWLRFGFAIWGFVMVSTAMGAEPANYGIPYKPDPPPAIDGRLDEWENIPNASAIQTREQVAYGRKTWKSAQDLSAKVWLAWRGEYLYLAADVTDDHHVQKERGRNMGAAITWNSIWTPRPRWTPSGIPWDKGRSTWGSVREACNIRVIP